jgi:hypothetical protein
MRTKVAADPSETSLASGRIQWLGHCLNDSDSKIIVSTKVQTG